MATTTCKHDAQWTIHRDRLNLYEPGTDRLHGVIILEEPTDEARWECARCGDRAGWFRDYAGAWGDFLDHEIRCPG